MRYWPFEWLQERLSCTLRSRLVLFKIENLVFSFPCWKDIVLDLSQISSNIELCSGYDRFAVEPPFLCVLFERGKPKKKSSRKYGSVTFLTPSTNNLASSSLLVFFISSRSNIATPLK